MEEHSKLKMKLDEFPLGFIVAGSLIPEMFKFLADEDMPEDNMGPWLRRQFELYCAQMKSKLTSMLRTTVAVPKGWVRRTSGK